ADLPSATVGDAPRALVLPAELLRTSRAELGLMMTVNDILTRQGVGAVLTHDGRVGNLQALPAGSRKDIEAVIGELGRLRLLEPEGAIGSGPGSRAVWLLVNTRVRGKIL